MNTEIKQLIDTLEGTPKENAAFLQTNCTATCNCGYMLPDYRHLHGVTCEYIMWCQEVLKHAGRE